MSNLTRRGIRTAQLGLVVNAVLATLKLVAGLVGHTYALVADAVESTVDIFSSLIVWGGLRLAARPADENHPYGHGKAEALAGIVVALMLVGAAVGIAVEALGEIRTPHTAPAPWSLVVLVGVMGVKFGLSRHVGAVGDEVGSTAVKADAWHHLSDAVTSAAAFIGISVALAGTHFDGRPGWAAADDWAALFAAGVIAFNGVLLMRPAVHDLMDRAPGEEIAAPVRRAAAAVPGVRGVEKLFLRKSGLSYFADIHVEADPEMPLREAHVLSGRVKAAIREAVPQVAGVLVHMEPARTGEAPGGAARVSGVTVGPAEPR
jgi:cation diffusion facilitator family transporter